ncbi:hypothetical protein ACVDFE_26910 [Lentzea chajnantorensis]
MLEGRSNHEMAHELKVSRRTNKFHLPQARVRRRTQLSSARGGFVLRM